MNLDQEAQLSRVLDGSGWHPGQCLDISAQLQVWAQEGYPQPPDVVCMLVAEFDGTGFRYPRSDQGGLCYEECLFGAVAATGGIYFATVYGYIRRIGEELWPVGYTGSRHVTLMASASGGIYGGYDSYLALYGEDIRSAILNIFSRKAVVRIN